MSNSDSKGLGARARGLLRGLREVAVFVGECAWAVFELCLGRWPPTTGPRRRKPSPPDEGMGPIEKAAPYPLQD